jgi:hypothetical protein
MPVELRTGPLRHPGRPLSNEQQSETMHAARSTQHAARRVAAAPSRFVSSSPSFMSVDCLSPKKEAFWKLSDPWYHWPGFLETGNSKVNTDRSSPRQHSFISRSPTALLLLLSGRAVLKEKVTRKAWIGSSELISEMKSGRDLPQRVYFLVCTARVEMMRQQCGGFKIRIEDTSIDE